jgi:Tol biopolymer transport system component
MSSLSKGLAVGSVRAVIALAALAAVPGRANAAFPGLNGFIAFESNRDSPVNDPSYFEIYVMRPDGSGQTRLTTRGGRYPSWSPDGSKIAFTSGRDGNSEIYVMNADGSGQTRLTERPNATDLLPVWSPDGSKIAFASFDSNYDIWVMNADGTGQSNLTNHPAEDFLPAWSPDGSRIAFQTNRDGDTEIYTIHPDGTGLTNVSNSPASAEWKPAWSPDGSKIAFAGNRDTIGFGADVYVMGANGAGVTRLTNTHDDTMPAWSPDGSRIAFRSHRDLNDEIYVMDADGGNAARLTNNAPPGATLPEDWFPDWQPASPDTTPPAIACDATPGTLWPDHRLHRVRVALSASDVSGPVAVTLVSVTSTQAADPDDMQGWTTGTDDRVGLLRAERARHARTYSLTYQAEDFAGNTARCDARVEVPANRRR